ncbi:hypothetical protein DUHN55_25280 [Helicobacter pylori]
MDLPVDLEDRVAGEDEGGLPGQARGDGRSLRLGQQLRQLHRRQVRIPLPRKGLHRVLVDIADDDLRGQAAGTQESQTGGGGRGEDERDHAHSMHRLPGCDS